MQSGKAWSRLCVLARGRAASLASTNTFSVGRRRFRATAHTACGAAGAAGARAFRRGGSTLARRGRPGHGSSRAAARLADRAARSGRHGANRRRTPGRGHRRSLNAAVSPLITPRAVAGARSTSIDHVAPNRALRSGRGRRCARCGPTTRAPLPRCELRLSSMTGGVSASEGSSHSFTSRGIPSPLDGRFVSR